MKKFNIRIKYISFSCVFMLMLLTGCNESFLETKPLDRVSSASTWADPKLAEAFVFNVYSFLGYGGFEEQALAAYTDEAMFTHSGRGLNTFTEGTETPSNLGWKSDTYEWTAMYSAIRSANVALKNLETATIDADFAKQLKGEATFLRAYYYHQLMRFYGGVPLISEPYDLGDDFTIVRSSFSETIDFIVKDLDAAASLLDGLKMDDGRATRLAALALKSRVLLYAASDLHESGKAPSGFGTELHAYQSGTQKDRWIKARDAAKAVLDLTSGYKLNLSEPVTTSEGKNNYIALAMGGKSGVADAAAKAELIFQRTETSEYTAELEWPLGGLQYGINNGPNGYHNWAGNTPIQQLVDDYEMMDGTKFDWGNNTHANAPYVNRDPRFYATILYDGADWKPRPEDVKDKDPANQIQTGYYDDGKGGLINGIDTRESEIENWNGSRTHYYTRKFIDPNPALPDNLSNSQIIPWPFIRVTEIVLNYCEALIELGEEDAARGLINKIRFRAGMPAISDAGSALKDRYRNERRIELAYEEHRYHDARRWLIAAETLGRGIKAINIVATLKSGKDVHVPYRYDTTVYSYKYEPQDNTSNETRKWVDKMYYRPISQDEMTKNNKLVQNPGY